MYILNINNKIYRQNYSLWIWSYLALLGINWSLCWLVFFSNSLRTVQPDVWFHALIYACWTLFLLGLSGLSWPFFWAYFQSMTGQLVFLLAGFFLGLLIKSQH